MKYKVFSLFSGSMGLDLGLHLTERFETLGCVENNKEACETIRLNQQKGTINPLIDVFEGDIRELDPKNILLKYNMKPGDLDVLIGGPPCQSFSTAGKRQSTQDPRGTLLWKYLDFVKILKPKVFLMENVRGLLSAAFKHRKIANRPQNGGTTLSKEEEPGSVVERFMSDIFSECGSNYHVDIFEVNSVNYGAPQIRERALFIGNAFGRVIDFPKPTHGPVGEHLLFDSTLKPWKSIREAFEGIADDESEILNFSPRKLKYLDMVPEGGNWRSLPEDIQKESMGKAFFAKGGRSGWWRRLTYDLPSPTVITMPNHASTSLCHPIETRALSVKEYARLQEFPDEWLFSGNTSSKYRQIGNAVPVRLGKVAGETIYKFLDDEISGNAKNYLTSAGTYRKVYINSHVRTRKWYNNGKAVIH